VNGVFPSSYQYIASSQRIQFHWNMAGDSAAVVTSFNSSELAWQEILLP